MKRKRLAELEKTLDQSDEKLENTAAFTVRPPKKH
jgi:hypothetical protein